MEASKPSRPRRRVSADAGAPAPLAVSLTLPPDAPADLVELARVVTSEAPRLLAGFDPDQVAVVLVHPRSPDCPADLARRGRVHALVMERAYVSEQLIPLGLPSETRPGWFLAVLVGVNDTAVVQLASVERVAFERTAS